MREILFRGIDTLTGNLVQGDLLHISSGCIIYHGSQTESEIKENTGAAIELFINEISVVKPETVGQFTRKHDKNGKRIFEKDKIKWADEDTIYTVEFEGGSFICVSADTVFNLSDYADCEYYLI